MKYSLLINFHRHDDAKKCILDALNICGRNSFGVNNCRGIVSVIVHENDNVRNKTAVEETRMHAKCLTKCVNQDIGFRVIHVNPASYSRLLLACASKKALKEGKAVHSHMIRVGNLRGVYEGNCLVNMYAKCGIIEDARQVFDKMPERDACSWTTMLTGYAHGSSMADALELFNRMPKRSVVSWNAMIAGYAQHGHGNEALNLCCWMHRMGVKPDGFTFASVLSVCGGLLYLGRGKEIHVQAIKVGFVSDVFVGTALVDMYAKCGSVEFARQVFDEMPERNVVSWTAMIVGYSQNEPGEEARRLFNQIHLAGMRPSPLTFVGVVSACAAVLDLEFGMQVHAQVFKTGFEFHVSVCNAIVTMYAKCGNIGDAQCLFDKMSERDLVSWNAMIAGYAWNCHGEEALKLGLQMHQAGLRPNQFTYSSILSVCSSLPAFEEGKQLHAHVIKAGFHSNVFVVSALVDMYGKSGNTDCACVLFENMSQRDTISYNAMIAGYVQQGHDEEGLKLFFEMQHTDLKSDEATFASVLGACANLAALEHGRHIHARIISIGYELHMNVVNALVTMYAKCGSVEDACQVFDKIVERDLVSWNAMITGYAQHGHGMDALRVFEQMLLSGIKPDAITFLGVISSCCHAGLVDEGIQYFHSMRDEHHISPRMDHHACIIDLLGRAGRVDEAQEFIYKMPFEPDTSIWLALLSACRVHGNLEIGKRVGKLIFTSEPQNTSSYVLLSNIYSAAGRWDDAAKVRKMLKDTEVRKHPGYSWIEVKNRVHAFMSDD